MPKQITKPRSTNNEEQEEENKKNGSSSIKTCSKMVYEYERVCVYGIPLKWVAIMTRHCYLSQCFKQQNGFRTENGDYWHQTVFNTVRQIAIIDNDECKENEK